MYARPQSHGLRTYPQAGGCELPLRARCPPLACG